MVCVRASEHVDAAWARALLLWVPASTSRRFSCAIGGAYREHVREHFGYIFGAVSVTPEGPFFLGILARCWAPCCNFRTGGRL